MRNFYIILTFFLAALSVGCANINSHDYRDKADSAEESTKLGDKALLLGQFDEALSNYVSVLNQNPNNYEILYKIGLIHIEKANIDLAQEAFLMALKFAPNHAKTLESLGLLQLERRNYINAVKNLNAAVKIDSKLWRAYNGLGLFADLQHDYPSAITSYTNALENSSASIDVLNNRGYSKYLSGDWQGAEQDYKAVLKINVKFDLTLNNLALLQARQGKEKQALQTFQQSTDASSSCNNVGYIYMLDGNYSNAERLFIQSIAMSPTYNVKAQKNLVRLYEIWKKR
ncbi:MAG: tetratricopeptide repeat protein [Methylococcaceae bacterium]